MSMSVCKTCGAEWDPYWTHHTCPLPDGTKFKSQKVKGLIQLLTWKRNNEASNLSKILYPRFVVRSKEELSSLVDLPTFSYPYFARPCPLNPQHGFVDSRVVQNNEQLEKVIEETLAADPEGEVML